MVLDIPAVSKCILNKSELTASNRLAANNYASRDSLTSLSHTLQLSLETDKILQLFFKHIKQIFKLSKLLYSNKDINFSIMTGSKVNAILPNLKTYELYYKQEYLGEISFASKQKLPPGKILELKEYVKLLILPLRNSLQYIKAIKETRKDPLTSTGNRLGLLEDLNYHFNLSARYNSPLSVLFLDIDYFKKINDQYGHIVGDKILINFASILKNLVRKSDMVYRFGGEEFVILLENTNQNGALNLAKKLKTYVNTHKINELAITVSIGTATKNSSDSCETMLDRADKALYIAKTSGRNRVVVG